ncbi:helix-turn-helix domain-containing protein [Streptomyces coacervatus]|uniref:Helix-turn-helix domain-containing protein n=1 Tax=Streptomyces coacervatus TaxID=647381 RepID=A0ABP7IKR3_9ACTN|nr:hypothetical protein [Streptomyces coacervatus]MDF2273007.1 hypothetical protein [Streptomyces coacervatus]
MADPQSNAPLRADAGAPTAPPAPTSGVIHVRTRLTANFTVIANSLAQRPGSAVTVGVAVYILSLPDGAAVSIAALCAHFSEGEILISRALRELEAAGYLERRRERCTGGRIRTRTYFHDVPARDRDRAPAETRPVPPPDPQPAPAREAQQEQEDDAEVEVDERAPVILASLRIVDPRLILSQREVAELSPAVTHWLAAGVGPAQVTEALTTRLPRHLTARPARILSHRLSEPPPAAPTPVAAPARPAVLPWQTCDGCERAFRSAEPALCRDCALDAASEVA